MPISQVRTAGVAALRVSGFNLLRTRSRKAVSASSFTLRLRMPRASSASNACNRSSASGCAASITVPVSSVFSVANKFIALLHHQMGERRHVGHQEDQYADQTRQRNAVEEDIAQDVSFAAIPLCGSRSHHDALRVDHLA